MKWLRRDRNDAGSTDEPPASAKSTVADPVVADEAAEVAVEDGGADSTRESVAAGGISGRVAGDGPSPVDGAAPDITAAAGPTVIASADVPAPGEVDLSSTGIAGEPVSEYAPASSEEVPDEAVGDGPDRGEQPADVLAERRALIDLLIYAWDRARSPGVWERLTEGLAAVGVSVLKPDGERFDPSAHEVGGTQDTDDDALVDRVAETEVVGFSDRGRVIREPIVVVYRRG